MRSRSHQHAHICQKWEINYVISPNKLVGVTFTSVLLLLIFSYFLLFQVCFLLQSLGPEHLPLLYLAHILMKQVNSAKLNSLNITITLSSSFSCIMHKLTDDLKTFHFCIADNTQEGQDTYQPFLKKCNLKQNYKRKKNKTVKCLQQLTGCFAWRCLLGAPRQSCLDFLLFPLSCCWARDAGHWCLCAHLCWQRAR